MAIIKRLGRLFRADLHAVLDQLEEPDILLKQAIREMEAEIDQGRQQLRLFERKQQQTEQQIKQSHSTLEKTEKELALSFDAENEPLIRTVLRRKLTTERSITCLQQQQDAFQAQQQKQKSVLDKQTSQLQNLQHKAAVFDGECQTLQRETNITSSSMAVSDDDVELAYLQERQQRSAS